MEWGRRTFEKTRFIRVKKLVISYWSKSVMFWKNFLDLQITCSISPKTYSAPDASPRAINQSILGQQVAPGRVSHEMPHCITIIVTFIAVASHLSSYTILSGLSSSLSSLSRDTLGYNVTHLRQECVTIIKLVHLIKFRSTRARFYPVLTAYQEWFSTPGNILLAR